MGQTCVCRGPKPDNTPPKFALPKSVMPLELLIEG